MRYAHAMEDVKRRALEASAQNYSAACDLSRTKAGELPDGIKQTPPAVSGLDYGQLFDNRRLRDKKLQLDHSKLAEVRAFYEQFAGPARGSGF